MLLATDEGADPLSEQGRVEGFAEGFVEDRAIESAGAIVVAQQTNQYGINVFRILLEIGGDHQGFAASHREVDDDAIGMQTFRLDTGFESAGGGFDLELTLTEHFIQASAGRRIGADDQQFAEGFVFQLAQGHSVFLEEPDQMFSRDASILRSWNPIAAQATGIEPFANSTWGNLTDLGNLSGRENCPHAGSPIIVLANPTGIQ